MHALGVIVTYYNSLEYGLFLMFFHYLNDNHTTAPQTIFARLNNQYRVDVVSRYAETIEKDEQVKDRVKHFLNGYNVCTDNRNFLAHSRLHGGTALEALGKPMPRQIVLTKAPRGAPKRQNYTLMLVSDLRTIADDIKAFDQFAWELFIYLAAQRYGGKITLLGKQFEPSIARKTSRTTYFDPVLHSPYQVSARLQPETSPG